MKTLSAVLLIICCSLKLVAQEVSLTDLNFSNAFEKQAFEDVAKGSPDVFLLFVASSGNATQEDFQNFKLRLKQFVSDLNPEKMQRYSGKKKVRKIFEAVQDDWLMKYDFENRFTDIFQGGYFNCVSSTALHALVLNEFDIPYTISEEPQHVYLVAQPDDENIIMEGTDPFDGYQRLTDRLVQAQLQSLVSRKIITEEELHSPDLRSVLNDLYPQRDISLMELVSIQYYNQAIYDFEKSKYLEAYQNALKAYFITPNEKFRSILYSTSVNWLAQRNLQSEYYTGIMAMFAITDTTKDHYDLVAEEFGAVGYSLLIEERKPSELDSLYKRLHIKLKEPYLLKRMAFTYHSLKADYAAKLGLFYDGYSHASQAMSIDPENLDVINLLLTSTAQLIYAQKLPDASDSLKSLSVRFPGLIENNIWRSLYAEQLLRDVWKELGDSYSNKVDDKIEEFESFMDDPNLIINHELIGSAYSRLALKRFTKSKAKAKETLYKALLWAPGNSNLLRVKQMLGV